MIFFILSLLFWLIGLERKHLDSSKGSKKVMEGPPTSIIWS